MSRKCSQFLKFVYQNKFYGQKLRQVTYFAEWHFFQNTIHSFEFLQSTSDLEDSNSFDDKLGAFYLLSM